MKLFIYIFLISTLFISCKQLTKAEIELKDNLCKECTSFFKNLEISEGVYKYEKEENKINFWYGEQFNYDSLNQYLETNLLLADPKDTLNLPPLCCPEVRDSLLVESL